MNYHTFSLNGDDCRPTVYVCDTEKQTLFHSSGTKMSAFSVDSDKVLPIEPVAKDIYISKPGFVLLMFQRVTVRTFPGPCLVRLQ